MKKKLLLISVFLAVLVVAVFCLHSFFSKPLNLEGCTSSCTNDLSGVNAFPDLPFSGNLIADKVVILPDLYETGNGFTCTGLAYDSTNDTFLLGDIGIMRPNGGAMKSQIVRLSSDFSCVVDTIPLYSVFPDMEDVQGITIDTSDGTIWFCSPAENSLNHVSRLGENLGCISTPSPTGVAYSASDDSFWVLNYSNQIIHVSKNGTVIESYDSTIKEVLDQCFLDEASGYLYITAGANYSGINNVYVFNTLSHVQSTACSVDSYSVEGIWICDDRMVILNDGYYHDAAVKCNQANIYLLNKQA